MTKLLRLLGVLALFLWPGSCFFNVYPKVKQYPIHGDVGEPLILTPLIKSGKIKEAQDAASVKPMKGTVASYSGFLTVNEKYHSNMFFWFFPAEKNYPNAPIVLWLQGGPGASSLFGLFSENGPFSIHHQKRLKLRPYSWTKTHSVLYIDNPVGTGFSFTNDTKGYARTETDVGRDLYDALSQFFQLFPQLQKNDFFVTGESYGGKYVPAVAFTIHQKNPTAKTKINLQGIAMGNGFTDPENMLNYGDYLYQIGLIDSNGRDQFKEKEASIVSDIKQRNWKNAYQGFHDIIDGDAVSPPSLFQNLTGFSFYFNYLHEKDTDAGMDYYIQSEEVRKAIHVGHALWNNGSTVEYYLAEDEPQSVRPWVEQLVENYRVLVYNGQLDIIVAYPLTVNYLQNLKWSGAAEYKKAPRKKWLVDGEIAGYSKTVGKLTELIVRNAGHMVPSDQPKWAFDLITRFTANKPF